MASLDVQTQEGERFIVAQGGTLAADHIFIDDAVSRAEFKKRKGLIALLNAAKAKEIDAVVVRDESRLGGDTFRAGLVIQDILESGVRLFYYYTNEEVTLDGAVDKFMIAARSFAAELEREKTSQRTHEHLMTKARKGLVVGGRVYGYDNVEVKDGERRVRVEYKLNEEQAAIVREIFRRYADGEGLRSLAKDLNARGIPAPKAGRRGSGSWSYSSIREMVRRERYRGVLIWGKHEKTYKGGTKVRVARAKDEWVTIEVPELRIVDDELWAAVQKRWSKREELTGSRRRGGRVRYFLSGFGRCAKCNGPMRADNAKVGYDNVRVYACAWHRDRGPAVCDNGLRRPVATVDEAVVNCIKENVLQEEVIAEALRELRRRLAERAKTAGNEAPELEKEAKKLRGEIERLGEAIVATSDPPLHLVRMMGEREKRLTALESRLAAVRTAPSVLDLEVRRMEREARKRLEDLRGMLQRNPEEARKALETILGGPLRFTPVETPEGKRYRIEGVVALEAVVAVEGDQARAVQVASPAGTETLPTPELDGNFARGTSSGRSLGGVRQAQPSPRRPPNAAAPRRASSRRRAPPPSRRPPPRPSSATR
ncbi:recombinase family protein [Polyangium aurulentum]|nr:recombinase family protein [Polyangium aurulentum]